MPALVAAGVVVALIGWNIAHLPPAVTPDGGFPAAAAAATRIEAAVAGRPVALRSLPVFKTAEAYRYPLTRDGADLQDEASADALVIVCDSLFETAIGAPCGGPAEDASLAARPFPVAAGRHADARRPLRSRPGPDDLRVPGAVTPVGATRRRRLADPRSERRARPIKPVGRRGGGASRTARRRIVGPSGNTTTSET